MKSVGEVMAIGRTFQESLQKALARAGGRAVDGDESSKTRRRAKCWRTNSASPAPERIWYVGDAFAQGMTVEEVHRR
jgi:carbamoyl-phosphate synthase large subunit